MTTEHNRAVVERFDALAGSADLGELEELCTPDLVNHALAPERPQGLAGTREFLSGSMRSFGDDGWEWVQVIAEGDLVVQHGFRGGTWRGGSLFGFELQPGPYRREVAFVYRLQEGRIAERWAVRDDLTMLRQRAAI
jgi:predicted ester cyclase